jgi:hypothetical protein
MAKSITKTYALTEIEIEIISKKADSMGDSSASAALRAIIREWNYFNSRPEPAWRMSHSRITAENLTEADLSARSEAA